MTPKDTLRGFLTQLDAEEDEFRRFFATDRYGVILRSAINELDLYHYQLVSTAKVSAAAHEEHYLRCLGTVRLIKLSLDARPAFEAPVVTFVRDPSKAEAVRNIVLGLGYIEHGRRLAQTVVVGRCQLEQTGDTEFLFTLPANNSDEAHYERIVVEHYREQSREWFRQLLFETEQGKKMAADVDELLSKLVYVFADHFIGYDADPLLDSYFYSIAYHEVQLEEGYDSFHWSTKFGGVSFLQYHLGLIFITALSFRHVRFAQALTRKEPSIKMENVLTITSDTDGFVQSLRDAMDHFGASIVGYEGTTLEQAQLVFEVLSVGRSNTDLLTRPGCPAPLLIRCSNEGFIRSIAAAAGDRVQFLLNSLRHRFPKEYDQQQQSREASMQRAIKRIFNDCFSGLEFLSNIKIKMDGRDLTDIDLVIVEPASGHVLLCQLKHQDRYGADLASARNRTERLKKQVEQWLNAMTQWLTTTGEAGVRSALRLSKDVPALSVHKLIVTRHFAYPIAEIPRDADASFTTWPQLSSALDLLKQESVGKSGILDLIDILRKSEGLREEYEHEPTSEWRIRNLCFSVRQLP